MANIQINNLQPSEIELIELSNSELEAVIGGGWFKRLTGISTPSWLRRIDQTVRGVVPGGWPTVIQQAVKLFF